MVSDRNLLDKDEDEDLTAMEEERLTRIIDHGTLGDSSASFEYTPVKTLEQKQLAKQKSQYYDGAFAVREVNSSAREIVIRESIICAEVKTNVIVGSSLPTSLPHSSPVRQLTDLGPRRIHLNNLSLPHPRPPVSTSRLERIGIPHP
jgi:hypothetical protein